MTLCDNSANKLSSTGLGNWLSDTIGLGLGDAIERSAGKVGLSNGNLSPAQVWKRGGR